VAGFRAWLRLGYCVTKGSKAIRIWAPCPSSQKQLRAWREAGSPPDEKPRTRWRLSAVFAQDQVAPLPPPAEPAPLDAPVAYITGTSHEDLIAPLTDLAREIGYTVTFRATNRGDGYCQPKTKQIVIADHLQANGRLATLIHELGHALLRTQPDVKQLSYAEGELLVESIALCACDLVGLDTSANSIPYLASWAESANVEVLEHAAQLTDRIARRIEERLLAETAPIQPAQEQILDGRQAVAA
jgi:antirestriction protein ArdC